MSRAPHRILPSQQELKDRFDYDAVTGVLTRKALDPKYFKSLQACSRYNTMYKGQPVEGINSSGYLECKISGQSYSVHRIVWKWVTGNEPGVSIDHKDGDNLNNTFENLRDVDLLVNGKNKAIQCNNTSGYAGVHFRKDRAKYVARVYDKGCRKHLGLYDTPSEAHQALLIWRQGRGYTERHGI